MSKLWSKLSLQFCSDDGLTSVIKKTVIKNVTHMNKIFLIRRPKTKMGSCILNVNRSVNILAIVPSKWSQVRHDICQNFYPTGVFCAQILHKSAYIGIMANSRQNSVNLHSMCKSLHSICKVYTTMCKLN